MKKKFQFSIEIELKNFEESRREENLRKIVDGLYVTSIFDWKFYGGGMSENFVENVGKMKKKDLWIWLHVRLNLTKCSKV